MKFRSASVLTMLAVAAVAMPQAHAANIITFDNNATACGGATLCSTNGTTGYTGTLPFNLSTIGSWFQIDVTGVNQLSTQTSAEPNVYQRLPDGTAVHRDECEEAAADPEALGRAAGRRLKAMAEPAFFRMATA